MTARRSSPQPVTMTWGRALPMLIVCGVFDLLRLFFAMFWFFGPAVAGLYCASEVNDAIGIAAGGSPCAVGATAVGYVASGPLTVFGVVMAMAIGLLGWLTIGLLLLMFNTRIFKANESGILVMLLGLGISEIPFLGSLPALTGTTWKLYHTQIKKEKAQLKEWQQEQAQLATQEREQQMTEFMQMQGATEA